MVVWVVWCVDMTETVMCVFVGCTILQAISYYHQNYSEAVMSSLDPNTLMVKRNSNSL